MNPENLVELLQRVNRTLPLVRDWIDRTIAEHSPVARPVATFGFRRLPDYFPDTLLRQTRIVPVNRILIPPLASFGMPELAGLEQMPFTGVTYRSVIFLHRTAASEATVFHELVHVLQWAALGVEDFLITYGMGLIQHGYAQNPFEAVAFDMQSMFDRAVLIPDLVNGVTAHALRTREWAAETFQRNGVVMGG